jgi:hypothetical protein
MQFMQNVCPQAASVAGRSKIYRDAKDIDSEEKKKTF